jgi:hypothetical protein
MMMMKNLRATHDFRTQKRTVRQRSQRQKETVLARQLFQQPAKAQSPPQRAGMLIARPPRLSA